MVEAEIAGTTRVDELYTHHIKPLSPAERLRLLAMIADDLAQASSDDEAHEHSLLELEGLGEELRQGVDAQEYVRELRREWDHRP